MCGIVGLVSSFSKEDIAERLRKMAGAIPYRGPDDCTGAVGWI